MAKLHRAPSGLKQELKQGIRQQRRCALLRLLLTLEWIPFVAIGLLLIKGHKTAAGCTLVCGGFLWIFLLIKYFRLRASLPSSDQLQILQSGLEGEQAALDLLMGLGRCCHIFMNLRIPYRDGESETDFIVVSPEGITIVEVKNSKGIILGDASNEELTQRKPHRKGDTEKVIRNPIRQVSTHIYRLSGFLRSMGIDTWVRGCVLFISGEITLSLTDPKGVTREKYPVFTAADKADLYAYIRSHDTSLSSAGQKQVVAALNSLLHT